MYQNNYLIKVIHSQDKYFNGSPTIGKFIEFGKRCVEMGVVATFDGVGFKNQTSDVVIDAIKVVGVKDLDFAGEFIKFVQGCDEIEVSSEYLFAWWDQDSTSCKNKIFSYLL